MPTLKSVYLDAKKRLEDVSSSPGLDAQLLICHVLDVNRAYVLAFGERELTDDEAQNIEALVKRRETGEPLAYIRGYMPFYDREFMVTSDVLIPRPETELLLEQALELAQERDLNTVVDVGTGSGALAVTFKAHRPQAQVYAVDISVGAVTLARKNADAQGVEVKFLGGNLLTPIIERGIKAQLVMANLPYIATPDMANLEVTRYEPHLALDGGADGLDFVREMLAQVPEACTDDAVILLEIGADQGQATLDLANGYGKATLYQDYAGLDRIVRLERIPND